MLQRIVIAGCVGKSHQHRRLFERQLIKRLVKVTIRCRFDTVVVIAVTDLIKIALNDLLFGKYLFDLDCQNRLFDLTRKFLFVTEHLVFNELLSKRTPAFNKLPCFDIFEHCTQDRIGVHTLMFKEFGIFHRDETFDKVAGNFVIPCIEAMLLFEDIGEFFTIAVVDHRRDFGFVVY